MAKYHVNPATGVPGACTASVRACPHGGADAHGDSPAEAVAIFEKQAGASMATPAKKAKDRFPLYGVKAFADMSTFDYAPHERERTRLYNAISTLPHQSDEQKAAKKAYEEFYDRYRAEMLANEAMAEERGRHAGAVAHAHPDKSLEYLVTSGIVSDQNTLHPAAAEATAEVAFSYSRAPQAVRERFEKLPARYHSAFKSGDLGRGYSDQGFKALTLAAEEMHAADPTWTPQARTVVPRSVASYYYAPGGGPRKGSRVGEAKDMQNVGPQTYSLLEDYAKLKFGEARADEFWKTVASKTSNKPKISDYFRAVKDFK